MSQLEEQVRLRIREEMTKKSLSQRDVSGILGGPGKGWSQSRVGKLLTGRVEMGIAAMESLCFAVGLSAVEAVRDRGLEFLAEMTPMELKILTWIKNLTDEKRDTLVRMFDIVPRSMAPARYAGKEPAPPGAHFGKPRVPK